MRWILFVGVTFGFAACESVSHDEPAVDQAFVDATMSTFSDPVASQLLTAALAATATQQRVHSENIANVQTPGYKRRVVLTNVETITAPSGETFAMPQVMAIAPVFSRGALEATERLLDVAIDGDGFFVVHRIDGSTGYCRDGRLRIGPDGMLRTSRNEIVVPSIRVPEDLLELTIAPGGLVSGRTEGSPDTITSFGQLTLTRFVNPAGLREESGIWCAMPAAGKPIRGQPGLVGLGVLKQGFCERSNVELRTEAAALQAIVQRRAILEELGRNLGVTVAPGVLPVRGPSNRVLRPSRRSR